MSCAERPYCPFALTVLAASWVLVAVFVGETGLLRLLPAATIPATLWSLVGILLLAYWKCRPFRSFIDRLDQRVLIAFHLTRFVGFYFLCLASRGELPARFANAAGWGDAIVAIGALLLLLRSTPKLVFLWNVAGLADILFVVIRAAMQLLTDRESMDPFTTLPLAFLPTLIVPVIIFSHIILFVRLLRPSRARGAEQGGQLTVISP